MRSLLKLMLAALLAVFLSVFLAPVAHAQSDDTFPSREIGVWKVYGYKDKCWMIQLKPVDGTILAFSLSRSTDQLYISGENRSWNWLESLRKYEGRLELGRFDKPVTVTGLQQEQLGPMLGIFVDPATLDFFRVMPDAPSIRVSIGDREMFDIPLPDTAEALPYYEKCARTLGVGPFRS